MAMIAFSNTFMPEYLCVWLRSEFSLRITLQGATLLSLWFENNYIKMNEDKSHLLVFGNKDDETTLHIYGSLIEESDEEKLLGVTLHKKLNFKLMIFVRNQAKSCMHWHECQDIWKCHN